MSLTSSQQAAIAAEGNVLVVAGAGTGKTHTLVERCLARVCASENPVSLQNVLLVTFTEAAAAEMRKRLREELEKRASAEADNSWLAGQLALVETALISTLHSFCFRLVREHFHELELDPQLAVLADEQSRLLAGETLDRLLKAHYAGSTPTAEAVQQLVLDHGRGWDQPVRQLILRVHHYTQTLRDPAAWFADQFERLEQAQPALWKKWFEDAVSEWRKLWPSILETQPKENVIAHQCADLLAGDSSNDEVLSGIVKLGEPENWPHGTKGKFRDPIASLFDEAEFLHALLPASDGKDPLTEDWNWVRPQMTALLRLVQEFTREFTKAKRELAGVDFHDLEQLALRLLVDMPTAHPTAIAEEWRARLRLVFVDEYQDINAAQDAILRALGGEGASANRFMVGDVKQSIYRFRLADPAIFQSYKSKWESNSSSSSEDVGISRKRTRKKSEPGEGKSARGQTIPLSDNFRSHETILNFVNALFAVLMRREVGGVEYDEPQFLRFGTTDNRSVLPSGASDAPRTELHLILGGLEPASNGETEERAETTGAEREARLIATRLNELHSSKFQIRDKDKKSFRDVAWKDMAILLRSPRNKAETYAKVFAQMQVPLLVARGGFFESREIMDLIALLQTLDNPLQDLPLLAVLRSPLVGLTLDELALVRLAHKDSSYWTALVRFHELNGPDTTPELTRKVDRFLELFHRWRQLARQAALSQCLESALDETHYESWLFAQPRGEQSRANVQRLLALTRQFDQFQRQGLFRFLRFVEAQLEAEADIEPAAPTANDAVQLMSIHQSKGLDFPIVVVADLGKRFNFDDLKERVILDEQYGLCPKVKPPHTARVYPSLPYWLAQRRQRRETLGEELRLFYVATTRARDLLILTGTATRKRVEEKWTGATSERLSVAEILAAKSWIDWLGKGLARVTGVQDWTTNGQDKLLRWSIYEEGNPRLQVKAESTGQSTLKTILDIGPADLKTLRTKLEWHYPFQPATLEPAKTSVSELRRRLREESDDEAKPLLPIAEFRFQVRPRVKGGKLSAAEIGTAHHVFLQMADLGRLQTRHDLRNEAERLRTAGVLSDPEISALDFDVILGFWESELGQRIRARPTQEIQREMPFTARFSRTDLQAAGVSVDEVLPASEFVVAQGTIDLAIIQPKEIWLVDFKTDRVKPDELESKRKLYAPQLWLYALALSRIYQRPVTESWLYFLSAREMVQVDG